MPERRRGRPPHPDLLTPAERRVLEELRKGGTNAEIAVRIGIGPETVKTHISSMLAKLELKDRQQLAAWREEDAPRRRWLLAPFLVRPLVAAGVVAGVAVVIAVILILLALVRGEREGLYVEGVGEIEGPVGIFVVAEPVERSQGSSNCIDVRHYAAALDLGTGEDWIVRDLETRECWDTRMAGDPVALVGDRLLVSTSEAIHLVALDGQLEAVLFRSDDQSSEGLSDPIVSPDGSMIAFVIDRPYPRGDDSLVVLDLQTGDEALRIEAGDSRIGPPAPQSKTLGELQLVRWSVDGTALWAMSHARGANQGIDRLHLIITLDGDVYVVHQGYENRLRFSPDLRYAISVRWDGAPRFDSLTVTELSTGRSLLRLTGEDGGNLAHVVGPVDGQYAYAVLPLGVSEHFTRWEPVRGLVLNSIPLEHALAVHLVDLATGETTVVDPDDGKMLDEIELAILHEQNLDFLPNLGRCFEDYPALVACRATDEVFSRAVPRTRGNASVGNTLVGYIWANQE
ncbi:MAG: helix-turn-helix transcriptional regulator [Chloroflexi bacterium]|nr:helix-turn-helix transcriptional regulator [Chloroflexota bacterium]